MAGKFIKGIHSKISIDTTDFDKSAKEANKYEKKILDTTKKIDSKQKSFQKKYSHFISSEYKKRESILKANLKKELSDLNKNYSAEERSTKRHYARMSSVVKKYQADVKKLNSQTVTGKGQFSSSSAGIQGAVVAAGLYSVTSVVKEMINQSNLAESAVAGLSAVIKNKLGEKGLKPAINLMNELTDTGLMNKSDAAQSIKNLTAMGYSIEETSKLLKGQLDIAIDNKQAHYSVSEAIKVYTEGLKNQNSVLTDSTGISENLSVTLKKQGMKMEDLGDAVKGAAARQVILNAHLKEAAVFSGRATEASNTYMGATAKLDNEYKKLQATLGDYVKNELTEYIKQMTSAVSATSKLLPALQSIFSYISLMSKDSKIAKIAKSLASPFMLIMKYNSAVLKSLGLTSDGIQKLGKDAKNSETGELIGRITALRVEIAQLHKEADKTSNLADIFDIDRKIKEKQADVKKYSIMLEKMAGIHNKTGKTAKKTGDSIKKIGTGARKSSDSLSKLLSDLNKFSDTKSLANQIKKLGDNYESLSKRINKFYNQLGNARYKKAIDKINKHLLSQQQKLIDSAQKTIDAYYTKESSQERIAREGKEQLDLINKIFEARKQAAFNSAKAERDQNLKKAWSMYKDDQEINYITYKHIKERILDKYYTDKEAIAKGTNEKISKALISKNLSTNKTIAEQDKRSFQDKIEITNKAIGIFAQSITGAWTAIQAIQKKSVSGFLQGAGQVAAAWNPAIGGILASVGSIVSLFESQNDQSAEQAERQRVLNDLYIKAAEIKKNELNLLREQYNIQKEINSLEKIGNIQKDLSSAKELYSRVSTQGGFASTFAQKSGGDLQKLQEEKLKIIEEETTLKTLDNLIAQFKAGGNYGTIRSVAQQIVDLDISKLTEENGYYARNAKGEVRTWLNNDAVVAARAAKESGGIQQRTLFYRRDQYRSAMLNVSKGRQSEKDRLNALEELIFAKEEIARLEKEQADFEQEQVENAQESKNDIWENKIDNLLKNAQKQDRIEKLQTAEKEQTAEQGKSDRLSIFERLKKSLYAMSLPPDVSQDINEKLKNAQLYAREQIASFQDTKEIKVDQTINNNIVNYNDNGTYLDRRQWIEQEVFTHLENFANKMNRTILSNGK